jgi:hypothetical protein
MDIVNSLKRVSLPRQLAVGLGRLSITIPKIEIDKHCLGFENDNFLFSVVQILESFDALFDPQKDLSDLYAADSHQAENETVDESHQQCRHKNEFAAAL